MRIKGPRLTLRDMTREEYHAGMRRYVADPVMEPNAYTYDRARTDEAYDRALADAAFYTRVGIFREDGEMIGFLSFKRIDRERGRCDLGIVLLNNAYKERGYGSEAFALAVDYAFDVLGLRAIYADTMGGNLRMQRILQRLGFRCYLRLEECYDMGDRWEDRLDYVLMREEVLELTPVMFPGALAFAREQLAPHGASAVEALPGSMPSRVWAAFARGQRTGVLAVGDDADIRFFTVKNGLTRQGIGRRLLDAASAALLEAGARAITVWAIPSAAGALERLGFATTDAPPQTERPCLIPMEKRLG